MGRAATKNLSPRAQSRIDDKNLDKKILAYHMDKARKYEKSAEKQIKPEHKQLHKNLALMHTIYGNRIYFLSKKASGK